MFILPYVSYKCNSPDLVKKVHFALLWILPDVLRALFAFYPSISQHQFLLFLLLFRQDSFQFLQLLKTPPEDAQAPMEMTHLGSGMES